MRALCRTDLIYLSISAYRVAFQKWIQRLKSCISFRGEYFERMSFLFHFLNQFLLRFLYNTRKYWKPLYNGFNKVFLKTYLNEIANARKSLIFISINIYTYELYIHRMNLSNEGTWTWTERWLYDRVLPFGQLKVLLHFSADWLAEIHLVKQIKQILKRSQWNNLILFKSLSNVFANDVHYNVAIVHFCDVSVKCKCHKR